MAYNNYNNRGGYGNNRGYNNRGGYNGGYDNRGGYNGGYDNRGYEPNPIPFEVGQMVLHRATGTELSVIRIGREQVECRLPDMRSEWFYVNELQAIEAK